MLTVHHLRISQSERIVWLCEELGIDYDLKLYTRREDNRLAPDEYKALHPMGIAPVITDGDLRRGMVQYGGIDHLDIPAMMSRQPVIVQADMLVGPAEPEPRMKRLDSSVKGW